MRWCTCAVRDAHLFQVSRGVVAWQHWQIHDGALHDNKDTNQVCQQQHLTSSRELNSLNWGIFVKIYIFWTDFGVKPAEFRLTISLTTLLYASSASCRSSMILCTSGFVVSVGNTPPAASSTHNATMRQKKYPQCTATIRGDCWIFWMNSNIPNHRLLLFTFKGTSCEDLQLFYSLIYFELFKCKWFPKVKI